MRDFIGGRPVRHEYVLSVQVNIPTLGTKEFAYHLLAGIVDDRGFSPLFDLGGDLFEDDVLAISGPAHANAVVVFERLRNAHRGVFAAQDSVRKRGFFERDKTDAGGLVSAVEFCCRDHLRPCHMTAIFARQSALLSLGMATQRQIRRNMPASSSGSA